VSLKSNHLYAVILAGGSGTRFWPLSRRRTPKQFLEIVGKRSLLQETLGRIKPLIQAPRTFIVANALYRRQLKDQLRSFPLPKKNILLEPEGKNTAPAILWAACRIDRLDPQAVMVVLPSDHLIEHRTQFLKDLQRAVQLAREGYLVTLGVVPNRPETGFGYLKTRWVKDHRKSILKVEQFTEKPSLKTAQRFLKEKKYLWNSGMFVWKTEAILKAYKEFLPDLYRLLIDKTDSASVKTIWHRLPTISVDYGILEKSANVVTVPALGMGWSDLGSWQALWEVLPKDRWGNVSRGDHIAQDCRNTLVFAGHRLVVTIGLRDLTVVDTPDALLVCQNEDSQKVKDVVGILKKQNRPQWIRHS